jgi:Gluconate 2-dehydrogenase subunit 3
MRKDNKTGLKRRDLLKLMTAFPGAAAVAMSPFATEVAKAVPGPNASAGDSAVYQPKVFDSHEWNAVHVLCDLIIPADQRSGSAGQSGVPEFIDDWLDFERGDLLTQIRGGLAWLDMESARLFNHDFVDCDSAQQSQLLDRIAYPKKAAPQDSGAVVFFNHLRDLVVAGFFTSEAGIRNLPYLGNEPRAEWDGCPTAVLTKLGLAKDSSKV